MGRNILITHSAVVLQQSEDFDVQRSEFELICHNLNINRLIVSNIDGNQADMKALFGEHGLYFARTCQGGPDVG